MANQPLAFAELMAGGVLVLAGVSGSSIGEVIKGSFTWPPKSLVSASDTSTGTVGTGGASAPNIGATPADIQSAASTIASQKGWNQTQLNDWYSVINQESGYNPNIVNTGSGAAGLAQFINGWGEYATYGGSSDSVQGQLTAMANYISQRYGDPSAAWAHETAYNWY